MRYDAPLIANRLVYGVDGFGVLGSVIRSATGTGAHGPGLLYNDWDSGDDAKQFRALIVSPPSSGTLFVHEDGSFTLTGAIDGSYTLTYRLFVDGVDMGTATASFSIGVTVYRPGTDVTGSWTPVGSGSVAGALADESLATYAQSSNLTGPQTCTWSPVLPAGTHNIPVTADRIGPSGQFRIVFLDAGNASVGVTSWQSLTASQDTYVLPVTTTASATQFRIEVQP